MVTRSPGDFWWISAALRCRHRGSTTGCATSRTSEVTWSTRSSRTRRQLHDADEELVDLADHRDEPLEVDRLGHVGVRVQLVAAQDVLVRRGRGQHDHRDAAQLVILLDLLEHLAAVAA